MVVVQLQLQRIETGKVKFLIRLASSVCGRGSINCFVPSIQSMVLGFGITGYRLNARIVVRVRVLNWVDYRNSTDY